jgi:hypothetical protein
MKDFLMFDLRNTSGFTDANDRHVTSLDVVEYRFGERRGILMEALQDGDAYVLFRNTRQVELVKWIHLCKVPAIDET